MTEPSLPPASQEEQRKFVKLHIEDPLEIGQNWYVIDKKWFSKWKDFVNYYEGYMKTESEGPGPINNCAIADEKGGLKADLVEHVHFELVPDIIWKHLLCWYGLHDGQVSLPCPVIEAGTFSSVKRVELYPLEINLAHYKNPSELMAYKVSAGSTLRDLEEHMRQCYGIAKDRETRLVGTYLSASYETYSAPDQTLSRAGVHPKQTVVIVEKEGDEWGDPNSYRKNNRSSDGFINKNENSWSKKETNVCKDNDSRTWTESSKGRQGLCGLSNLGNTCFMNSALQCMSNIPTLTQYFLDGTWKRDLNKTNPIGMKGKLATAYNELITTMWSGSCSSTPPRSLKTAVGQYAPQFSGYQQQDSQELMAFLLDGLHEDLNRILQKPFVETKEAQDRPDEEVAEETWSNYKLRNDSVIIDTFHGLLKSRLKCPSCKHLSITFDPFCFLSLPLPASHKRLLDVSFVPSDFSKQPLKCKVLVPKRGFISDLLKAVGALLHVAADRLVVADVHNKRFHKIFDGNSSMKDIHDKDNLFVYEVERGAEEVLAAIYIRCPSKYSEFPYPLLTALPRRIEYEALYNRLLNKCSSFISSTENNEDVNEDVNEDDDPVAMECDPPTNHEAPPTDPEAPPANPVTPGRPAVAKHFQIVSTTYGEQISHLKSQEGEIMLKERSYLGLDFQAGVIAAAALNPDQFMEHESYKQKENLEEKKIDLRDCLSLFTSEEQLSKDDTWYCPKCKDHVEAYKKFDIWNLPDYLLIHLKRFSYSRYWRDKLDTFVDYPLQNLDLSDRVQGGKTNCVYDLIAVSNHYGGMGGGHYTAYALNHHTKKWYYFDDSSVSSVSNPEEVISRSGYVLVYERRKLGEAEPTGATNQ